MEASRLNVYEGRNIVVLGGTGFLGKRVTRLLENSGAKVYAVGRQEANLLKPLTHRNQPHCPAPDLVFHLAAQVSGILENKAAPYDFMANNVFMAINAIDYAVKSQCSMVAAGSVCVYSDKARVPFDENDIFLDQPERTNLGYGYAKRFLLQALQVATAQHPGFRFAYVNTANLYGPGDNSTHVIPDLIRKVLALTPENDTLRIMGDGRSTRDFLYVEDAAKAYALAGARLLSARDNFWVNAGAGYEVSIETLAKAICRIEGIEPKFVYDYHGENGQRRRRVNIDKIMHILRWQPETPFLDGLRNTVIWHKEQQKNAQPA